MQVHVEDDAVEGNRCGDGFKAMPVTGISPFESADLGAEYDGTVTGATRAGGSDVKVLESGTAA